MYTAPALCGSLELQKCLYLLVVSIRFLRKEKIYTQTFVGLET